MFEYLSWRILQIFEDAEIQLRYVGYISPVPPTDKISIWIFNLKQFKISLWGSLLILSLSKLDQVKFSLENFIHKNKHYENLKFKTISQKIEKFENDSLRKSLDFFTSLFVAPHFVLTSSTWKYYKNITEAQRIPLMSDINLLRNQFVWKLLFEK